MDLAVAAQLREGDDVKSGGAYVFAWSHGHFAFEHTLLADKCAFDGCATWCVLTRPFCSIHAASERGVAVEGREHGMTVLTTRAFKKHDFIVEVLGELLDWESLTRRYGDGRLAPLVVRVFRTSLYADAAIERSVGGMVRTSCVAHHNCEYVVKEREDGSGSAGLWIRAVADIGAKQELSLASSTSTVAAAGGTRRSRRVGKAAADVAAAAAAAATAAGADHDVDALSSDDEESPTNNGDRWTTYHAMIAPSAGSAPEPRSEPLRETFGYGEVQSAVVVDRTAARERLKQLFLNVNDNDAGLRQRVSRDDRCVFCAICG